MKAYISMKDSSWGEELSLLEIIVQSDGFIKPIRKMLLVFNDTPLSNKKFIRNIEEQIKLIVDIEDDWEKKVWRAINRRCPNCGAKMDEEENI